MVAKCGSRKKTSSFRAKILAERPVPKNKSWIDILKITDPQKAQEIYDVVNEWQDPKSEIAHAYLSRTQLFIAIAKECGVSYNSVARVFGELCECR